MTASAPKSDLKPRIVSGIGELAPRYDAFLVDVWGVLHDGFAPYPGVVDCLLRLRSAGKRVVLLSNVGRRAASLVEELDRVGIARELYERPVSSGESAWTALRQRSDPGHARLGRRCLIVGPDPAPLLEGLDVEVVMTVEQADFLLAARTPKLGTTETAFDDVLKAAVERHLPMLCTNPDLVAMVGDQRVVCPGAFASRYQSFGGEVLYHGKPYRPIYDWAISLLGDVDRGRICGVGDALRTDVAGAAGAGLDAILVATGIHAEEIGEAWPPDPGRIGALLAGSPFRPTAIAPGLRW